MSYVNWDDIDKAPGGRDYKPPTLTVVPKAAPPEPPAPPPVERSQRWQGTDPAIIPKPIDPARGDYLAAKMLRGAGDDGLRALRDGLRAFTGKKP